MSQELSLNLSLESKAKEHLFKVYRKEDEIHFLDDLGVWQVNRGVVQLSRIQQDGNEVIVGWLTANSTFENSFNHSSVIYRAIALSDVYIRYYSPQDIAKSPILRRQLIDQFCDRLVKSQQLLTIIAIRCFEERLRRLLLMLKHEIGTPLVDDTRLPIRFTHSHLADVIGTSRITITKILGNFQSQGLIYFDNERHIVIKGL